MPGPIRRPDEQVYWRNQASKLGAATAVGPQTPGPDGPVPDGTIWGEANAASVGPLRALLTRDVVEIVVPCPVSPLGIANQAVRLAKNDFQSPMYVRVKLARNGIQGQMLISRVNAIKGGGGQQPGEWCDMTLQPGRQFEAMLLNGESLYAIGTWAGIVPLFINVTVATWNP